MPVTVTNAQYKCAIGFNYSFGSDFRRFAGQFQDSSGIDATLPAGTGAGQVNKEYTAELTIATGSPALIDLTSLTDENGNALTLSAFEAIKITNTSIAAGEDLTFGGGTNGVFAACPIVLKATTRGDSVALFATPITVDSTHKILQLAVATGTAVIVRISLLGR